MKWTSFKFYWHPGGVFVSTLWLNMKKSSELKPEREPRIPLDDAQFAIVVLAVTSLTLIIFVLTITLWLS
ncbi:hypothetical protein NV64_06340 [Erwinia sp. B116]|nr:hypothetical protein ASF13_06150 [Erwinia sp. Leaf53]PLV62098.1 hypothetical protein NV64_06340 [Erwinia sp. B116]